MRLCDDELGAATTMHRCPRPASPALDALSADAAAIAQRRQERHAVNGNNAADLIRCGGSNPERQEAAKAVAYDDRLVEFLRAEVADKFVADAWKKRRPHRRRAAESGERQHVQGVTVLVTLDRRVPHFAGRQKPE